MKLPCAVVRDLLPLYKEGLTEDETKKLVDEHLADCEACRRKRDEIDTAAAPTVESTKPLMALKKEIRRRRWISALAAALLVFVAVYAFFYRQSDMKPVPWQPGLIEVQGVEARPRDEVYEGGDGAAEDTVDVLVLRVDDVINGTSETMFTDDEDGKRTVILQGWSSHNGSNQLSGDGHELTLCPVPDRLVYSAPGGGTLVWGEEMNGGVEILPRLALGFYLTAAAALALVSGLCWFILRRWDLSWIVRQVFFAPVSYIIAHVLIKGGRTQSFFMERDFISIVLIALAVYALLSLAWQMLLERKKAA